MKSVALKSEELNRKKSLKISVILHTTILLLAFLPFLNTKSFVDNTKGQMIIAIDFSHSSSSAKNKAAAKTGTLPKVEEVKKLEPAETKTEIKETQETPEKEAEPIVSETQEEAEVTAADDKTEVTEDKVEMTSEEPTEESAEEIETSSASESNEANGVGALDEGNAGGANDLGNEEEGEFGGNGEGEVGFDDSGDGIFGRQVIKHGNLSGIMKKSGRIAVKVCINKLGKVKEAAIIKEETTITDSKILKEALDATIRYLFERDQEAPSFQCGKLTYVLDIEKDNSVFSFFE